MRQPIKLKKAVVLKDGTSLIFCTIAITLHKEF
jgi:hypothetical protein